MLAGWGAAGGVAGALLAALAGVVLAGALPVGAVLLAGGWLAGACAVAGRVAVTAGFAVAGLAAAGAGVAGIGLVVSRLAAGVRPRSGVAGDGVAMAGVLAAAGALLSGSWAMTRVGSEAASLLTMRPELTGTLPGVVSGLLPEKLSRMGMAASATATSPAAMARRFFSSGLMAVADSGLCCGSWGEGVIAD